MAPPTCTFEHYMLEFHHGLVVYLDKEDDVDEWNILEIENK
jgi:hypothetical protein